MRPLSRRRVLATVVAALAVTAAVPAYADHDNGKGKSQDHKHAKGPRKAPEPKPDPCRDGVHEARQVTLWVDNQEADALVSLPRVKPARGIVVFDHGYGHTMESWRAHVVRVSAELGVIAIAPNYRNQTAAGYRDDGLPRSTGWRVVEGAQDTIAFAREYERLCNPGGTNVVYGVSMGGNTSGLAVAARPQRWHQPTPLFDYWVDVEGAANVTETYLGAVALSAASSTARQAQKDIEAAFGGRLDERPEVYARNTVVLRAGDVAAAGLRGVVIVHGVADGLVTHDQSRQLQAALRQRGVPVDMWSAVTRKADTEAGTTIDGYVHDAADTGHTSPFAGHASETSMNHVVGLAGFAALRRLYSTSPFTCGEAVYDGTADSTLRLTNTGC